MDIAQWQEWFYKCMNCIALIKTYLNIDPNKELLKDSKFEALLQKAILVKFYIEHLCNDEEILFKRCIAFWNYFDERTNFKTYETYKKFITIIKSYNKLIKNAKSKDVEKCKGCDSITYASLYKLNNKDCKCLICENCLEEVRTLNKCPSCSNKIQNSNANSSNKILDNSFLKQYNNFKENLNCLYMDVVSNLCFDGSTLPDDDVINAIIEDLLPKTKTETSETSDDQLFDLNLTPSIKSTLFQLLLNFNQQEIEKHLNKILSKSSKYVKENYNTEDIMNVKLMYLNSIEDQFYSKGLEDKLNEKLNIDVKLGISFLNDLLGTVILNESLSAIQELNLIAKIKFCLYTCAKLLFECDYINQIHTRFVQMMKEFIEVNKDCLWFRFFLIKQIFRRYGKSELLKSTQMDMFTWIVPQDLLTTDVSYYIL
jgi:hypothetical protein